MASREANLGEGVVSKVTQKSDALCILVVEDDLLVRLVIAEHLRDQGYAVVEVNTGEAALSLLRVEQQPPISVVFTDIQLGGQLNGCS